MRFWQCFFWLRRKLAALPDESGFVVVAGVLAAIATNVSYWNFPGVYTASYILTEIIGFLVVGIVASLVLRKRATAG